MDHLLGQPCPTLTERGIVPSSRPMALQSSNRLCPTAFKRSFAPALLYPLISERTTASKTEAVMLMIGVRRRERAIAIF